MRKFEINSLGYYETFIHKNEETSLGYWGTFYKDNNDWFSRCSDMWSMRYTGYYLKLKTHLDNEFNIFQRKQKLININKNSTFEKI